MRHLLLIFIILLGFLLRTFDFNNNPIGFFCDEADIGYSSYQFLKTGKVAGQIISLYSPSFGFFRPTIAIYAASPFIALFGLNEFSVRLASAFIGTATIILVYLITQIILKKNFLALVSALLLAISPWHIHFSRIGFECIYLPFFLCLSIYLFFTAISKKNTFFLSSSFFVFGLSLYTYLPAPLLVIPLFFILTIIFLCRMSWKNILIGWIILLLFASPIINRLINKEKTIDYFWVNSIFTQKDLILQNKLQHIVNNYLSHFSPDFLMTTGDQSNPRHSVRGMGELYSWQYFFIPIGLIYLLFFVKNRFSLIIILWLLLYPIGSLFTRDTPFANRSITGVIPFQIISAFGLGSIHILVTNLFKKFGKDKILSKFYFHFLSYIFFLFIITSFIFYLKLYFIEYQKYSAGFYGWQYGPRDIMKYFLTVKDQYDDLYMSGEFNGPTIFPKFYDPENKCQNKCKIGDFLREPTIYDSTRRQLFSLSPEYLNQSQFKNNFLTKKIIYYPNGNVAFVIGEVIPF